MGENDDPDLERKITKKETAWVDEEFRKQLVSSNHNQYATVGKAEQIL